MNAAAEAGERAVRAAILKAAIIRALAAWETWIVMSTLFAIARHFRWIH